MITEQALKDAAHQLETEGYAVVKGVVPRDLCARSREGIHAYMREAGIDFADPTLKPDQWPQTKGIVETPGVGQIQAVWDIREHVDVAKVFAFLHGTEEGGHDGTDPNQTELLVSFDRVCVQPTNLRDTGAKLHTDQSHLRPGRLCIQGLVNLTPALDEGTGTLMVLPRGHLWHSAFAATYPDKIGKDDWFQYEQEQLCAMAGGAEHVRPIRVFADVGDLVLWDSRTPHRAAPPAKKLPDGIVARERNVVYTCFEPRRLAPHKAITKKRKAYDERRMTSHWPAATKLFPGKVSTFRRPHLRETKMPERDDRTRSQRQLALAGMTEAPATPRTTKITPGLKFDY